MKIAALCLTALLLVFGGVIIFRLWRATGSLSANLSAADAKLVKAQSIEQNLSDQLEYLSHPENVMKELRARFNLHLPGEHTVIIVLPATSAVSSTP